MTVVGTLRSVNVGMPRDVRWRESTVHTGIWKYPVAGPVRARRLNLDGDGQGDLAGHGGEHRAVMVYQTDSYRYWAAEFRRDDLTFGNFGENFTVDGMADDAVCIGDRYRIGDAEFEVTQPRVTCYRVGMRLGEPRMAALLVAHHRPGFYLRVLREGDVATGDDIVRIAAGQPAMTVAGIDALLYLPGKARDDLARALQIDALSEGWKQSFRELAEQIARPAAAWPGFRSLPVADIVAETPDIRSIYLASADGTPLPGYEAGQYLTVRLPLPGGGTATRSYSLSSLPGAADYRITIKRESHGVVSQLLHTAVSVGDQLEVAAPRGAFVLGQRDDPVLLASAGVGITPVLSMLHQLASTVSKRQVIWLHTTRSRASQAFAAELDKVLGQLPAADAHVFYTRAPGPPDAGQRVHGHAGRLTQAALRELELPPDAEAYLCGPQAFMDDMRAGLIAVGVAGASIRTEVFGALEAIRPGVVKTSAAAPHQPPGPAATGLAVTFSRTGMSTNWADRYGSLLELAEACDVPTRWSCRTGVCHTCMTEAISGTVSYDPEPLEPADEGSVLICCSRPDNDVVLDL